MPDTGRSDGPQLDAFAYGILFASPVFFSSNLVIGRAAIGSVEPFTLAFLRWALAFLVMIPFVWRGVRRHREIFFENWLLLCAISFLSMWICGAVVYIALRYTTATNGTLIYTTSPVMIMLMEWIFRGRPIARREAFGIVLALAGVVMIVVKGDLDTLLGLRFNFGDILFAICMVSWAGYSVLLKRPEFSNVPTMPMFAASAGVGAILLFPFMVGESVVMGTFPTAANAWASVAGLVIVSSVLAFSTFQYAIKLVGPSIAGMFMYLLPPYGVLMAVVFLGERLHPYHFVGFLLIMSGLMLGTLPKDVRRRIAGWLMARMVPGGR